MTIHDARRERETAAHDVPGPRASRSQLRQSLAHLPYEAQLARVRPPGPVQRQELSGTAEPQAASSPSAPSGLPGELPGEQLLEALRSLAEIDVQPYRWEVRYPAQIVGRLPGSQVSALAAAHLADRLFRDVDPRRVVTELGDLVATGEVEVSGLLPESLDARSASGQTVMVAFDAGTVDRLRQALELSYTDQADRDLEQLRWARFLDLALALASHEMDGIAPHFDEDDLADRRLSVMQLSTTLASPEGRRRLVALAAAEAFAGVEGVAALRARFDQLAEVSAGERAPSPADVDVLTDAQRANLVVALASAIRLAEEDLMREAMTRMAHERHAARVAPVLIEVDDPVRFMLESFNPNGYVNLGVWGPLCGGQSIRTTDGRITLLNGWVVAGLYHNEEDGHFYRQSAEGLRSAVLHEALGQAGSAAQGMVALADFTVGIMCNLFGPVRLTVLLADVLHAAALLQRHFDEAALHYALGRVAWMGLAATWAPLMGALILNDLAILDFSVSPDYWGWLEWATRHCGDVGIAIENMRNPVKGFMSRIGRLVLEAVRWLARQGRLVAAILGSLDVSVNREELVDRLAGRLEAELGLEGSSELARQLVEATPEEREELLRNVEQLGESLRGLGELFNRLGS
jgi:hypothetical protein